MTWIPITIAIGISGRGVAVAIGSGIAVGNGRDIAIAVIATIVVRRIGGVVIAIGSRQCAADDCSGSQTKAYSTPSPTAAVPAAPPTTPPPGSRVGRTGKRRDSCSEKGSS
jgi:hypothetical protein